MLAEKLIEEATPYQLANWTQLAEKITHAWQRSVPTEYRAAAMLAHEETRAMIRAENERRHVVAA